MNGRRRRATGRKKRCGLGRDERGFLGLGMLLIPALMAIIMLVMIGVVAPNAMRFILGGVKFPELLVHVPLMPPAEDGVLEGAGMGGLSTAMGNLQETMQLIALAGLGIALLVAGIYYMCESLRVVSEGTASRIIAESFIVLILIFAFPYIYNAGASLVNAMNSEAIFGGWDQAQAITQNLKDEIVTPAQTNLGLESIFIQLFVVFGSMMTFIGIVVGGAFRLFMIGALAIGMPLLLVFRLFPFLRGLADNLINNLIGLIVASTFASIFLVFSWSTVQTLGGGFMRWGIAFGGMLLASMVPMIFAPAVGRALSTATHTVAAGAAGAVAGGAAMLGGSAVGAIAGARYGVPGMRGGRAVGASVGALRGAASGVTRAIPIAGGGELSAGFAGVGGVVAGQRGIAQHAAFEQVAGQPTMVEGNIHQATNTYGLVGQPSVPEDGIAFLKAVQNGRVTERDLGIAAYKMKGVGHLAEGPQVGEAGKQYYSNFKAKAQEILSKNVREYTREDWATLRRAAHWANRAGLKVPTTGRPYIVRLKGGGVSMR